MAVSNENKRVQLINLAIDLMNQNGLKKTTLDDIASVAGMAAPSLYYYFRNKNDVVKAVLSTVLETTLNEIDGSISVLSKPEEQFSILPLTLYGAVKNSKFIVGIDIKTKSELTILVHDLICEFNSDLSHRIRQILEKGISAGVFKVDDPEFTAEIIAGVYWEQLEKSVGTHEFETMEKKINTLTSLFLSGLRRR